MSDGPARIADALSKADIDRAREEKWAVWEDRPMVVPQTITDWTRDPRPTGGLGGRF